jgi:hypothetical protein
LAGTARADFVKSLGMSAANILKISVLSTGSLLLDGEPVSLTELASSLEQAAKAGATVWYYRQNASGEAPPQAMEVMRLIAANRLKVRLSSQPDFSDSVIPPPVPPEELFARMRERASQRYLAILRPDGQSMLLPAPTRETAPPDAVAAMEKLMPSNVQRNVAVIGDTSWTAGSPSLITANQSIPFFGQLIGLATIGHAVWIFDAMAPELLRAGCSHADVLIVDSTRIPTLPPGWLETAAGAMRGKQVLLHDRITHSLRRIATPGHTAAQPTII